MSLWTKDLGDGVVVRGNTDSWMVQHPNGGKDGRSSEWCAAIIKSPPWRFVSSDPVTIKPSINCPCGWHAFITEGRVRVV